MENLDINLEKARLICNGKVKLDKEHKIDSFTSINISGYYRYLNLRDKRLLAIGSSADEIFNGAFYGANDITLMEDNPYTRYYYFLKLASLYSLTNREFEWFLFKYVFNHHPNNKMFSKRLFRKIKPVLKELDEDSYNFFNELFDEFDSRVIRDKLFNDTGYHRKAVHGFDMYIRNDDTYNKTRRSMLQTTVNHQQGNILTDKVDGMFDVVDLSTLCTTNPLHKMINLYDRLDKDNLDENGLMVLGYLWDINMYTEDYPNVWKKIYEKPDVNRFLNKYVDGVYSINGYRDYLWEQNNIGDRVLMHRKTKGRN